MTDPRKDGDTPHPKQLHEQTVKELEADIVADRYGKPMRAALDLCVILEEKKDELERQKAALRSSLELSVSCLCSLRKNYEDKWPIWKDVNIAIKEGNAALAESEKG